ncbi:MAG: hypothetical protein JHC93_08500 [Parachlamydiales bacterium]|nr:hypothetical protein [Parachlamydiales bacterium]
MAKIKNKLAVTSFDEGWILTLYDKNLKSICFSNRTATLWFDMQITTFENYIVSIKDWKFNGSLASEIAIYEENDRDGSLKIDLVKSEEYNGEISGTCIKDGLVLFWGPESILYDFDC